MVTRPIASSESALAGSTPRLVCGQAKTYGEVEIHTRPWPAIVVGHGGVLRIESTGLPLGMFCESEFSARACNWEVGDTLSSTPTPFGARNEGHEYGVDRVMTLCASRPRGPRRADSPLASPTCAPSPAPAHV